jgi:MFS transporter, AAHS family, 4-hydroxybenzoate transporter
MDRPVIDVTRLVDEQRLGGFTIRLVALAFLVMLTDCYDLLAAAYAGPGLIAAWHIPPATLGRIFSASPLGMMFGAPLLGWLGDRFGRRHTIILGLLIYGLFTLGCIRATSVDEMMVLRFFTGIGLGGMLPNIAALIAEFAPRRVRATAMIIMFLGITTGSMIPGFLVTVLPGTDWQSLFLIGGLAPLAIAALLAAILPESIKFLALRGGPGATGRLLRLVAKLRPDLRLPANPRFVIAEAATGTGTGPAELFRDGLHLITPLLWLLFVINLMTNYFLYSWMPTLFHVGGFSTSQAALITDSYYAGGMIGGLVISRLIDRTGLLAVLGFFLVACPAVGLIGFPGLGPAMVAAIVFVAGFAVFGIQHGINAVSGLIYPTRMRANGAGWAFGVGRLGGIAGPMLGALLIGLRVPLPELFLAPVVPLAIGALACLLLLRLCRARFGGNQFGDLPAYIASRRPDLMASANTEPN